MGTLTYCNLTYYTAFSFHNKNIITIWKNNNLVYGLDPNYFVINRNGSVRF